MVTITLTRVGATTEPASYEYAVLAGAKIAYQLTGSGPAVVLVKNNRRPRDLGAVELLADRFRVVQVHPVGFGASDRPPDYSFGSIGAQVLAVLQREQIDRFVVWGFSQTGCMAAMVARSTDRAVALVAGGVPLIGVPTNATMRRFEREPRLPTPPLEFWRAYRGFDWHHELKAMTQPKLVYIGTSDPALSRMRRIEPVLRGCGCDYVEFQELNHTTAGLGDSSSGAQVVVKAITGWLEETLPRAW